MMSSKVGTNVLQEVPTFHRLKSPLSKVEARMCPFGRVGARCTIGLLAALATWMPDLARYFTLRPG